MFTLLLQDTVEMSFSRKRQRFLVNQGYAYKVGYQIKTLTELLREGSREKALLVVFYYWAFYGFLLLFYGLKRGKEGPKMS